ncbi:MAG TPA: DUF3037 domain-containing protein [Longimicrobium sp.]|jgi:hypothetical protein|uniref:DUF3037 domain-containing protein n=1 Tax=Longimicrobium sp. TaxID=2029185 RepID=UPI002ED89D17
MSDAPDSPRWIAYSFAVLCVVPHPHLGTAIPVGVILHARTAQFIGIRVLTDPAELAARAPGVDVELLCRYLDGLRAVAEGASDAGPVALLPTSERFHWLTAPRSDVLQTGRVHSGLTEEPAAELERLFTGYVG